MYLSIYIYIYIHIDIYISKYKYRHSNKTRNDKVFHHRQTLSLSPLACMSIEQKHLL